MRKIIRGPNFTKMETEQTVQFWNRNKTRKWEDCGVWIDGKKVKDYRGGHFVEKCRNCGSSDKHQVSPADLEREDPEGYDKHGFYSFLECAKCGHRWFDD